MASKTTGKKSCLTSSASSRFRLTNSSSSSSRKMAATHGSDKSSSSSVCSDVADEYSNDESDEGDEGGESPLLAVDANAEVAGGHACWVCAVPLLTSYEEIHKSLSLKPSLRCLYRCQTHPFLALSSSTGCCCQAVNTATSYCVCAVCADRIFSLEQGASSILLTDKTSEMDGCSLCGKRIQQEEEEQEREVEEEQQSKEERDIYTRQLTEEEMGDYFEPNEETLLLLCDSCPRAFCQGCWKRYKPTFQDILEPLQCPLCCQDDIDDDGACNMNQSQQQQQHQKQQQHLDDISVISFLLAAYETELTCVETHRSVIHLSNKKEEILIELQLEAVESDLQNFDDPKDLDREAQQELALYRKFWEHHAIRLEVEVPILQELLVIAGGNLQEFYRQYQQTNTLQPPPQEENQQLLPYDEEAKLATTNFKGASGYKATNEKIYELDPYPSYSDEENGDDERYYVDDIQSLSDALNATKDDTKIHPCWRAPCLPKEKMFRKALEEEDRQRNSISYCSNSDGDEDAAPQKQPNLTMMVRKRRIQEEEEEDDNEQDGESALVFQVRHWKERRRCAVAKRGIHNTIAKSTTKQRWLKKEKVMNEEQDKDNDIDDVTAAQQQQEHTIARGKKRALLIPMASSSSNRRDCVFENKFENNSTEDEDHDEDRQATETIYLESDFCLFEPDNDVIDVTPYTNGAPLSLQSLLKQKVTVAEPIAKELKDHQREGIQFMWNNICGNSLDVNGCVLAHNMGLGKSLQTIALVHTLLTHPAVVKTDTDACPRASQMDCYVPDNRLIRKILLLAPVNTLANWENEFIKWIQSSEPSSSLEPLRGVPQIPVYSLYSQPKDQRKKMVRKWHKSGGVLLTSPQKFALLASEVSLSKHLQKALVSPGPDLMVVDEAHGVFNKENKKMSPLLSKMNVSRRIALTGTPFQNNLYEYFVMANWVRPGCLQSKEEFKRDYVGPIMDGLKADSTEHQKRTQEELIHQLYRIFRPFVHRKDSTILQQDLPFIQQTVIVVRQSRVQQRILQLHKKYQALTTRNFFGAYSKLKPIFNHPGTLMLRRPPTPSLKAHHDLDYPKVNSCWVRDTSESLLKPDTSHSDEEKVQSEIICIGVRGDEVLEQVTQHSIPGKEELSEANCLADKISASDKENAETIICLLDSEDEEVAAVSDRSLPSLIESEWWSGILRDCPEISDIKHGGKMNLLLQILAHADHIAEKVVVFSHSLQTLDFIENLLNQTEWESNIPAIKRISPGKTWGHWKKNIDYVRIDGGTEATARGELITQFNEENGSAETMSQLKLFLLSSRAGGVGINLVAATRVVIMDPHFNPTVDLQALYRCYRYGQTKPVFVYRLLCEGTMEEKVYRRQVNKTSLSKRLVDQNNPVRHFTKRELDDIATMDLWVQCDKCDKWRMLHPAVQDEIIPDKWFCYMNTLDKDRSTCDAKERDERWYHRFFDKNTESGVEELQTEMQSEEKEAHTNRDQILSGILTAQRSELMRQRVPGQTLDNWMSKYHFHDALLKDDPAFSRAWFSSSRENTPSRQTRTSFPPQCTSFPVLSSNSGSNIPTAPCFWWPSTAPGNQSVMPTAITSSSGAHQNNAGYIRGGISTISGYQSNMHIAPPESLARTFQSNEVVNVGVWKSAERRPILSTDLVIEIMSSDDDDEGHDSDFEILE